MSLLGICALPVVNAELFCKRWVYSLLRESNGGVDGCWLPTHITHSISSSHLQLKSLSRCVMVLQRMQCNWAPVMRRPASQLYVGIATFHVAAWRTRSASYKRCNALVKVDRAVLGCADLNNQDRIWSSRWFESDLSRSDSIRIQYSNRFEP